MDDCCEAKACELEPLRERQRRVLLAVLGVNAAMFLVEAGAGLFAGSTALLGDSLDMAGDAFVYAFSLYVLQRGPAWRARAALAKGLVMVAFGVGVLLEAVAKLGSPAVPPPELIAGVGALALAANGFCFALLFAHRSDDINLRSTWLCSRNDLIANCAVLVAAGLVWRLGSAWPDILVGAGIAALFLRTAATVLRESLSEIGRARSLPAS